MSSKKFNIRLKKGDLVKVRSGSDKGKTGKIVQVLPGKNKVLVEGLNVVKKHRKATKTNPQGGIIEINKPIWVSKVGIITDTKDKPSKIAFKTVSGKKERVIKRTGKRITR